MKELDRIALFRLSVLGPLISRPSLERGELQAVLRDLAQKEYAIPGSRRRYVAEKTFLLPRKRFSTTGDMERFPCHRRTRRRQDQPAACLDAKPQPASVSGH